MQLFILKILLLLSTVSTNSYTSTISQNIVSIESSIDVPIDKKRKKTSRKKRKNLFKKKKQQQQNDAIQILKITSLFLLALLPIFLIVVHIFTGGLGWLLAGFITLGLWLISNYLFIFGEVPIFLSTGVTLSIFLSIACIALIIWGALVILEPVIIVIVLAVCLLFLLHIIYLLLKKNEAKEFY